MAVPATKLKFYRRVQRLKGLVHGDPKAAALLVRTALHLWHKHSYQLLAARRAPHGSAELIKKKIVSDFVTWLTTQPFEEAAYWLASTYATLVGENVRTRRSLFFTPPALADRVINHLVANGASLTTHRWHDPACGGAAFLVPIAIRMQKSLARKKYTPRDQIRKISANLSGNDLDPVLSELSRSFVEMALYPTIKKAGRRPRLNLHQGDGLTDERLKTTQPHVLAINPPYRKLGREEVKRYLKNHQDVIERQPNIYGLFINRAIQIAPNHGLIGLLTPTSFLSGTSFSKLREKIIDRCNVLQIDMLSDRSSLFIDVEQETAITLLRSRDKNHRRRIGTKINVLKPGEGFKSVGRFSLPKCGRPWVIPRASEQVTWLKLAKKSKYRLADYGYRCRIGHLVGYRDERKRFSELPTKKPAAIKKTTVVPLVWATDISPTGNFRFGHTTRIARTERFVEVNDLDDKGVITKRAVILQRLTSNDQKSRLITTAIPSSFVKKYGGFVCENHVIVLEQNSELAIEPNALAALLNTSYVNDIFRCISGSSNVSVYELNELMLPNPSVFLEKLANSGDASEAVRHAYVHGHGSINHDAKIL